MTSTSMNCPQGIDYAECCGNFNQPEKCIMRKTPFLRTPYNYDRNKVSQATGLVCRDKTRTQQQFRDECNINILFARYLETGEMPQVTQGLSYGDFTGIFDFQTAMNAVRTAQGVFMELPARIRNRFSNDPQKLVEFLGDPENREEAEFLGLVKKPDAKGPTDETRSDRPAPQDAETRARPAGTTESTREATTDKKP